MLMLTVSGSRYVPLLVSIPAVGRNIRHRVRPFGDPGPS